MERKRIAAVLTWYVPGSHSDVLVGKFLPGRGIALDDGFHPLRVDLVSIYLDQTPTKRNGGEAQSNDIGLALAEEHGVEVYSSIREALCCSHGPGGELAVDGVIVVGEHGDCELLTTTHTQQRPRTAAAYSTVCVARCPGF